MKDLELAHLWVVYPGNREFPVAEGITAMPLTRIGGLDSFFRTEAV